MGEDLMGLTPSEQGSSAALRAQETFWLVEWPDDDNMPIRWWHPVIGWVRDANKALRLFRKADADAVIAASRFMSGGAIRATEHKLLETGRGGNT